LQVPQKVTLRIAKATADATVSSTVVDGPLSVVNTMNGQEGGGNFALPNTGGMGAVAFLVAGAALVAFAVASFARSRKGGKHGPSGR
ncbi:MAG: LPXTG cell wall anchor domain-containing protein, partial [Gordonibacter pamelaeae]